MRAKGEGMSTAATDGGCEESSGEGDEGEGEGAGEGEGEGSRPEPGPLAEGSPPRERELRTACGRAGGFSRASLDRALWHEQGCC